MLRLSNRSRHPLHGGNVRRSGKLDTTRNDLRPWPRIRGDDAGIHSAATAAARQPASRAAAANYPQRQHPHATGVRRGRWNRRRLGVAGRCGTGRRPDRRRNGRRVEPSSAVCQAVRQLWIPCLASGCRNRSPGLQPAARPEGQLRPRRPRRKPPGHESRSRELRGPRPQRPAAGTRQPPVLAHPRRFRRRYRCRWQPGLGRPATM